MSKNTNPIEMYDDNLVEEEQDFTQEEILMNENDILAGLLEAGRSKDSEDSYKTIKIKRGNKLLFTFRVRPMTEEEAQSCYRRATKYAKGKGYGQPKTAIETDNAKFRAYRIYTATVDEDRAKTWDNRKAWDALGVITGVDMIDMVLLAGEKDRILDVIDEVSGYNDQLDEIAGK